MAQTLNPPQLTSANPQLIWGLLWHNQICIGLKTDATLAMYPWRVTPPWSAWYWRDGTPFDWNGFTYGDGSYENDGPTTDGMIYVREDLGERIL